MEENFLHYKVDTIKYLGLLVDANLGRHATWEPLVMLFTKRLTLIRNRFSSLVGRVVLLNLIFNAILNLFLCFMKMSIAIWRNILGLQMLFL